MGASPPVEGVVDDNASPTGAKTTLGRRSVTAEYDHDHPHRLPPRPTPVGLGRRGELPGPRPTLVGQGSEVRVPPPPTLVGAVSPQYSANDRTCILGINPPLEGVSTKSLLTGAKTAPAVPSFQRWRSGIRGEDASTMGGERERERLAEHQDHGSASGRQGTPRREREGERGKEVQPLGGATSYHPTTGLATRSRSQDTPDDGQSAQHRSRYPTPPAAPRTSQIAGGRTTILRSLCLWRRVSPAASQLPCSRVRLATHPVLTAQLLYGLLASLLLQPLIALPTCWLKVCATHGGTALTLLTASLSSTPVSKSG